MELQGPLPPQDQPELTAEASSLWTALNFADCEMPDQATPF